MITHTGLRDIAKTLNSFCVVEIIVVFLFCYLAFDLLAWYKMIMTAESFNGTAFWGAIISITGLIFGSIKHINETFKKEK
tara:strand:- start:333 stop:572 length:240 start_codon:yes stop_codon:yes gene_type:complete